MSCIFVYGTLLKGERNHSLLKDAICRYQHAWIYGKLFDTNRGYPVMKQDDKVKIYGEIYEVTGEQLKQINKLEGYKETERTAATAYNDMNEALQVVTYTTRVTPANSNKVVPFGNWKVYNYLKHEKIFYFAYGSCMDDERFKLAKVDKYFKAITGRGVLDDHGFRFTRDSSDGGKADLIESRGEIVEGVVYKVPLEAVDYLYEREGVYSNAYRPAIVQLKLHDGEIIEAITFIGVSKSKETKPTNRYATEIIRGARGVLSQNYIKQLDRRINQLMI
ncbi:gamma-glutamylcyclotransferase [Virgibacillus ainsalahensis]